MGGAVYHPLAKAGRGITMMIGFVDAREDLYHAVALVSSGRLAGIYHKHYLPNYSVFERALFVGQDLLGLENGFIADGHSSPAALAQVVQGPVEGPLRFLLVRF